MKDLNKIVTLEGSGLRLPAGLAKALGYQYGHHTSLDADADVVYRWNSWSARGSENDVIRAIELAKAVLGSGASDIQIGQRALVNLERIKELRALSNVDIRVRSEHRVAVLHGLLSAENPEA